MLDRINTETLPNALMMGVDYELFWVLNPKSLTPFIKAFSLRQKYDDAVSWKQGLYIRMAVGSLLDKNTKYPNLPLMENEVIEQRDPQEIIKERFLRQVAVINARFGKEEKRVE